MIGPSLIGNGDLSARKVPTFATYELTYNTPLDTGRSFVIKTHMSEQKGDAEEP